MYQKIKALCEKRGISISFLEKELGLSNGSISKWASSMPRVDSAIRVAKYLKVSIDDLVPGKDESN